MLTAKTYGKTDVGCVRKNNEDAFYTSVSPEEHIVVASAIDGLGGYEGGEVAAEIARHTLEESCSNPTSCDVKCALVEANNRILAERRANPNISDMGCVMTVISADLAKGVFNMAHVGDSRLYQYSNGFFTKLSHDHSLVGYREEIGELTELEAMHHPQRNIINKVVGANELSVNSDYVETAEFPIIPGSTLLLCSDGLCDMVTSHEMVEVLSNLSLDIEQKADQLVQRAKDAGGKDNVTVVLVEFGDEIDATTLPVEEDTKADTSIPNDEIANATSSDDQPDKSPAEDGAERPINEPDVVIESKHKGRIAQLNERRPGLIPNLLAMFMAFSAILAILLFIYLLP